MKREDHVQMRIALQAAQRGEGYVEPNPMVGCVIVTEEGGVGEGYHQRFGGPHAEIEALREAGPAARGATMYVTLEPCCHHGKTPPCTDAIVASGIRSVYVAQRDPFPKVDGGGIRALEQAGVEVQVGLMESEARALNAPYLKLVTAKRPWVIAKWAMSLDGKIATRTGDSQWISNDASRAITHKLRGRVDAILVGSGTARADDPLLTARPHGPRTATRIVLDSDARLALDSRLVRSAREPPVLIAAAATADRERIARLSAAGCEVLRCGGDSPAERLGDLLDELGRRGMTNVLIEGGAVVLGVCLDAGLIDEVHVFVAPKLIGGRDAPSPIAGVGLQDIASARVLRVMTIEQVAGDLYVRGRLTTPEQSLTVDSARRRL